MGVHDRYCKTNIGLDVPSAERQLTHDVLTTFMADIAAIINARPLIPITTDPDDSFILMPAAHLTQKVNILPVPAVIDRVRWKKRILPTLQPRRKWQSTHPNIKPGSVVLLKDIQVHRNEWPLGLVTQTFPSKDGKVCQVEVIKPGGYAVFLRPITEIVLLLSPDSS